jgi:hypothetical protein
MKLFGRKESPDYALFQTAEGELSCRISTKPFSGLDQPSASAYL